MKKLGVALLTGAFAFAVPICIGQLGWFAFTGGFINTDVFLRVMAGWGSVVFVAVTALFMGAGQSFDGDQQP